MTRPVAVQPSTAFLGSARIRPRRPFRSAPAAELSYSIALELRDRSVTGLGVETNTWLQVGRRYDLRVRGRNGSFRATARVAWCRLIATRRSGDEVLPIYRAGLELGRPWPGDEGAFDRQPTP